VEVGDVYGAGDDVPCAGITWLVISALDPADSTAVPVGAHSPIADGSNLLLVRHRLRVILRIGLHGFAALA